MIKVLIVEDDPMVAELNKRYLEQLDGFDLIGIAHSVEDASQQLKEYQDIDLLLLDVYMPGKTGLELMSQIREQNRQLDIILITAASETDKIQQALRYGAFDYLVKPFEFERLQYALTNFKEHHHLFNNSNKVKQEELDRLLTKGQKTVELVGQTLPKGLTDNTLKMVIDTIKGMNHTPFSTDDVAEKTNISRVSIRKYLKYLKDINFLEETLTYGVGRPVYLYSYNKNNYHK